MRAILVFILFTIFNYAVYGQQPVDFSSAVETDRASAHDAPTCGIYTYNPRIENGYYCVDWYGRNFGDEYWKAVYKAGLKKYDLSNFVGRFAFGLMIKPELQPRYFKDRFDSYVFEFSPALNIVVDGEDYYLLAQENADKATVETSTTLFGVSFGENSWEYADVLEYFPDAKTSTGTPFFIGTLKMHIKAGAERLTAGFKIYPPTACSIGVWDPKIEGNQDLSTNCCVVGWLDGIDPDIPLTPQGSDPEDPTVPAGPTPLCAGLEGIYAISALPKNTDLATWKVFNGSTEVNSDVAELTLGADKKSVTIKWKQAGSYQVKVWGKNSSSGAESANPGVLNVTVNAAPAIAMLRDGAAITTEAQKTICSGLPLNLSVAQVSGVTYAWQDGTTKNTFSVTPVNKGNADITQKYKVTATQNSCSASDSVLMTINQEPDCVFDPTTTSYPIGSLVSCGLLCNNPSSPLKTYSWTSPLTSTEPSIEFELPAGSTSVVVTVTNQKNCSATFTETIRDNGQGLQAQVVSVYGNEICQGGAALLKATLTKTVGSGPYTFKWYKGQGATGELVATHEVNGTEDLLTVDQFAATSGIYYSVKVSNSSMLSTTANSEELRVNTAKTSGAIIAESPLVAATPDKKVLLYASTNETGSFDWQWLPANLIDGSATANYAMTQPISANTIYTVLMHNTALNDGCLSKKEVEVRLPENNLAMTVSPTDWTLCQNGSIQLNTMVTGGGSEAPTYKWTSLTTIAPGNVSSLTSANPKYTALADRSGKHEYLLRVAKGAQVVTTKVTVEVKDYKVPVLAVGDVFCSDSALTVTSTGGAANSYDWFIKKPDNTWITQHTADPKYPFTHDPGEYQVKVVANVDNVCVSDTASNTAIEVRRPTVAQVISPTVYPKGSAVSSTATAANGWGNYTYDWVVAGKSGNVLPGQNSNIYTINGADEDEYSFNLTVTDAQGCQAVADMKKATANNAGMSVQLALVNKYCQGGSVLMGATVSGGRAPYTYTWKKADGTVLKTEQLTETISNYFVAAAGVEPEYQLTVTDATTPDALSITKTLTLTPENLAVPVIATEGRIKIMPAAPAVLRAELTTPTTGGYQWQWSGNQLSAAEAQKQYAMTAALNNSPETYEVYVVDGNGCISAPQTEIVEMDNTNGFAVNISYTELAMCKNTSQLLEAVTVPEQTGATYDWASIPENLFTAVTKDQQKPEINPSAAGNYRIVVTVTNTAGVKNTAEVDITVKNQTPPQLAWNYNACQGDTVRIQTSDAVIANGYTWYVDGNEVLGNKTNALPVSVKGEHTISVVVAGANDCKAQEQQTYTIKEQPLLEWDPEPTGIEVNVPFTAQVKASPASGDFTYHWTKPASGNPAGKTCTVTATASDKTIDFQVYAIDNTSGCKTNIKEKSVNVENDVIVPNVFVLNNKVCLGGSAVLEVLSVNGADGPFNYEWKKEGSAEVLGTGSKLVVSPVNGPVNYTVTVSKQTNANKKGSAKVELAPVSGSVPTLEPFNMNVAPGNSAILVAKTNAVNPQWNWGPAERLASADECHKAYPETMTFTHTGDSVYQVYVVDQGGCVSPKKELIVHIQNDNTFRINLTPDRELCIGNKELYTAEITGGTGNIVSSVWLAQQHIEGVNSNLLQAMYTASTAGLDTVAVVVNKGGMVATAKLPVKISSKQAPTLQFEPFNPCADSLLVVKAADGSALKNFNWKITKDGVEQPAVALNQYKLEAGNYALQITATGANECPANGITEEDFTVYPNPEIRNIVLDTDCDTTRLAAVTVNGDNWTWTKVSGITGYKAAEKDSIWVLPHVNDAMSANYEYSVVAGNAQGCRSIPFTKTGTVYTLPVITMNPDKKNLYPNKDLTIEASMTPALSYTLAWSEQSHIAQQLSDTKIQTNKLAIGDYDFTFTVTNTENTGCRKTGVTRVHVTDADMKVEFEGVGDTLELCDGTVYQFKANVVNNMTDKTTYKFQVKTPSGAITTTPSEDGTFAHEFTLQGDNRYQVYVTATDAEANSRKDTVVVDVNPNPAFRFKDEAHVLGTEYALCQYNGKLEIEVQATAGTPEWDLYYRVGSTLQQKHLSASEDKLIITEGGEVVIDSIVDAKKCKLDMGELLYGFAVVNDIPQFKLTAEEMTICQNVTTDLGIQFTAKATDYPLEVFAKRGVTKVNKTLASASEVLAFDLGVTTPPRTNVTFTVDSVRSARGCTYKPALKQQVKVSEYPESTPELVLSDTTTRQFCDGDIVQIPVNITGGKAAYTIDYKLGNTTGQKVWTAADNKIELSESGIFRITGLTDGNGCGLYPADDSVRLIKYAMPSMKINNLTTQMCGGQLDLDLTLASGTAPYTIYYSKDNGAEQTQVISTLTADKKGVWTITEGGKYVITKVTDQHCEIAGTEVTGGPELNVLPLRLYAKMKSNETVCATAGANIELDFTGTVWGDVKGKVRVNYDFTPAGTSAAEQKYIDFTLAEAQATPKITPAPQGTYVLTGVVDLGAGNCGGLLSEVEGENQITVIDAPTVTIDSLDFAVAKDEIFVLGVKKPEGDKFEYAWQINDGEFIVENNPPFSKTGVMGDADLKYVLKGTNKTATSCFNTDTVNVYRIPDAPILTIDTNDTRNELILKWYLSEGQSADGYILKSRQWDAYGIEGEYDIDTQYGAGAQAQKLETSEIQKDTLKFFYVQAIKNVRTSAGTKIYLSASSDTVGFKYDNLALHTDAARTSNHVVSWLFDIPWLKTSVDLYNFLGKERLTSICGWEVESQGFFKATTPNPFYEFDPENEEEYYDAFNLNVGEVYLLSAIKANQLITYGKLRPRDVFDMPDIDPARTNNYVIYLGLHKVALKCVTEAYKELGKLNLYSITLWDFENQGWLRGVTPNPFYEFDPENEPEFEGEYNLKPSMPLQLNLINPLKWK